MAEKKPVTEDVAASGVGNAVDTYNKNTGATPGGGTPGATPAAAPSTTPAPVTAPATSTPPPNSDYVTVNDRIYNDRQQKNAERDRLAEYYKQNPDAAKAMTLEEMQELAKKYGVTGDFSQYYGYIDNAAAGTSQADEYFLSNGAYELVQSLKNEWWLLESERQKAVTAGDTALAEQIAAQQKQVNNTANSIRMHYDYTGGTDGSVYFTTGALGLGKAPVDDGSGGGVDNGRGNGLYSGNAGAAGGAGTIPGAQSDLNALLEAWQQAALKQSNGQIDYGVAKAVADLERALQDAQPMFKEQAESVDRSARQAMDNSALYAEMRGDKGGIGQEQYNSIQNTQAQNHLAVQQAQTKLATDTQRQIADLRAQGEFEKADAALQITQQYLQQLIGLEQWAAEYNLSVDQFNEQIRQWEMEYNMAMQQLQIGQSQWQQEFAFQQQQYANSINQWQAEFDAAQNQWQQQFDYNKQSDMANIGWALLESGIPLSEAQMSAMGIDPGQASQVLMQKQLEAALKANKESSTPVTDDVTMSLTTAKELAKNGIFSDQVLDVLRKNGYDDAALSKIYGYVPETGLPTGGEVPTTDPTVIEEREAFQYIDEKSVIALGLGPVSYQQLKKMEADGVILIFDMGDQIGVTWAPGWTQEKYKQRYG